MRAKGGILVIFAIKIMIVGLALGLTGCSKRPSYVLSPNKMAQVMADLHIGEAVVENNHAAFSTDSAKMALKQSIFARNGIDQQKFDTSMVWYAHNMDKYMDVCDREIKLLEKRNANAGTLILEMAMSMGGDSVDVWGGSRYAVISDRFPTKSLSFDIKLDENMDSGDYYIWRMKLVDADGAQVQWTMLANYADSTCDYLSTNTATRGWNEMSFYTDSTRQIERLRGLVSPSSPTNKVIYIDSIQLIRKRVDRQKYNSRYRQRLYRELYEKAKEKAVAEMDSIKVMPLPGDAHPGS